VLIDHDFHFVDAWFEEEDFAGKSGRAGIIESDDGVERAIHRAFHNASHRDQVVDESVVENRFGQTSCWGPFKTSAANCGCGTILHAPLMLRHKHYWDCKRAMNMRKEAP